MRGMTWYYVTLHGFTRDKAKDIRLKKLRELLAFARRIGIDYVVFENFCSEEACKVRSQSSNRRITRFAMKQLLQHGLLIALKTRINTNTNRPEEDNT